MFKDPESAASVGVSGRWGVNVFGFMAFADDGDSLHKAGRVVVWDVFTIVGVVPLRENVKRWGVVGFMWDQSPLF